MTSGAAPTQRTLFDGRSAVQRIRLAILPGAGLSLVLDDAWQFTELTEHRYHEALVVVPLTIARPRRVLVGGGGDGLAAARLLRDDHLERLVLCDFDETVLDLARRQPELVALNGGALADPRVQVVTEDLATWLPRADEPFDLVVLDLPDAVTPALARLYSVELFAAAKRRLAPGGLLVTQTCITGRAPAIIANTLGRVFRNVRFYRMHLGTGAVAAFTLASDGPLDRVHEAPPWTRHLTTALVDALFAVGKDELEPSDEVNTLAEPALYRELGRRAPALRVSRPYVYNQNHRTLAIGPGQGVPDALLEPVLEELEAMGSVIAYVDERRSDVGPRLAARGYTHVKRYGQVEMSFDAHGEAALARAERDLPAGLVASVEAWRGRPDHQPDVLRLVETYVDIAADRAFDAVVNYGVTEMEALYLLARAPDGEAVALWKVNDAHDPPEAEFFYGVGPHARNKAALLRFLRYAQAHLGPCIVGLSPVPRLVELLLSLGLRLRRHVDVYRWERLEAPDDHAVTDEAAPITDP